MFDFLSKKFSAIFSSLTGKGIVTEKNIKEALTQVQEALLESDVPYDVIESFILLLKKEIIGQKVTASLNPTEQLMKVVHTKLVDFLGGKRTITFAFQLPAVIMVMGLQGSGKTTTIAKIAHWVQKIAKKRNKTRKILCASVDFYRPAAVDQLAMLAQQVDVSFYRATSTDPLAAAKEIQAYYKNNQFELLFLDTAGRLHIDNNMLQELQAIDEQLSPQYKLLVLDAMTGQESLNVAQSFEKNIGFHHAALTKMDSDTRGGAAFSFCYTLKKPVVFVGEGEKVDDLSLFHAERMASRILGMGDIQTLIEKADEKIKQSEQKSAYSSFVAGRLTLNGFAQQMDMLNKLGSLSQIAKYLPGMNDKISPIMLDQGEKEFKKFRVIINSMTKKEQFNPRILNGSRRKRIAQGAGVTVSDVNLLLDRFEQMQQYVKLFKGSGAFKNLFK
ncbi:MAG: signal recognition particle protein [Candidatus Babeliales bacterium]|jgi:signal recognition particle subunit SRP54